MTGHELIAALQCGKPRCACAQGRRVHCPAPGSHKHGDANPSLGVGDSAGRALVRCYAGCSQDDVINALKERGLWGEVSPERVTPIRQGAGRQLVKVYEFRNAADGVVAEHGRFEAAGGVKSFAWRLPGKEWSAGLGSTAIHDLPLYRLQDVLANPDETVWFCEGEKAVEACRDNALVAVCLGGGAAQQAFGNTLDVLRGRDVVLWPDNDEPGAAFMGRIHALLPDARFVRPVVPHKGDAFDYFAAGGTVEGLNTLLEDAAPTVTVMARDAITVVIPVASGRIRFEFSEMFKGVRSLDAQTRVVVDVPGKRRTPYSTRLNLESSSGRNSTRLELDTIFGKDLGWTALLSEACGLAQTTWLGIDPSVDLADIALPEERVWAIDKFAPAFLPTIVFGMGGSGKSYLLADIGLHSIYGMPWKGRKVREVDALLVIDYEDHGDEWRLRIQQLCDAYGWEFPERGYRYMSGDAIPLADQMPRLRRVVADWGIGLVIVDSAASAVGGELSDPQAVARMVNALADLGPTAMVIAHNTKAEDSNYPFGSIFWHNLVRATHYVEAQQDEGSNVVELAIYNRKSNRGKQKPIGMRMTFDPHSDTGPVSIDLTASIPASLQTEAQANRWLILNAIKEARRPMAPREIEEATGLSRSVVSAELSRNKRWFTNVGRGRWAVLHDREEDAV